MATGKIVLCCRYDSVAEHFMRVKVKRHELDKLAQAIQKKMTETGDFTIIPATSLPVGINFLASGDGWRVQVHRFGRDGRATVVLSIDPGTVTEWTKQYLNLSQFGWVV